MHEIKLGDRKIFIPEKLSECNAKQLIEVCDALYLWQSNQINYEDFRINVLCKLMNIDYKNISLLTQYITPAGRIIPSMISSISQPNQRKLRQAIKRARMLALLPFSSRN